MKNLILLMLVSVFSLSSFALGDPEPMDDKEFNKTLEDISNWGGGVMMIS